VLVVNDFHGWIAWVWSFLLLSNRSKGGSWAVGLLYDFRLVRVLVGIGVQYPSDECSI
jgi:hypothetical protein